MVIFPSEITMGIMNSFPFYGKIHGKIVMIFEWKFLWKTEGVPVDLVKPLRRWGVCSLHKDLEDKMYDVCGQLSQDKWKLSFTRRGSSERYDLQVLFSSPVKMSDRGWSFVPEKKKILRKAEDDFYVKEFVRKQAFFLQTRNPPGKKKLSAVFPRNSSGNWWTFLCLEFATNWKQFFICWNCQKKTVRQAKKKSC